MHSVPVTVMDWTSAPVSVQLLAEVPDRPVILAAPVNVEADQAAAEQSSDPDERDQGDVDEAVSAPQKAGRAAVPDELYPGKLRELVAESGGVAPSIREVARRLSIGQDRAGRLVGMVKAAQE
jgi:hypothetical protein